MTDKTRGRCKQTAKGMHAKARLPKKAIKFYYDRRKKTPYKQYPLTAVQKNGNSGVVEADGVQCHRDVGHV